MENSASPDLEKSVISNNQPDFPPPIQVREPVKQAATGTSKGKLVFAVPNINKQIMRPNDSIKVHCSKNDWNSILAEDEAHNKKLHRSVPKYPWMKNGQTERPKMTERNNNICLRDDTVTFPDCPPLANPEDMDLQMCFTKLPSSVKNDITFHHLASLHSNEIISSFGYIKEKVHNLSSFNHSLIHLSINKVFVAALLEFLPKLSMSARTRLSEAFGPLTEVSFVQKLLILISDF